MKVKRLNDLWTNPLTTGIFSKMTAISGASFPWSVSADKLDLEYHMNHSGGKMTAPVLDYMANEDGGTLSDTSKATLAELIYSRNIENWNRLFSAVYADYDPIENYNGTETHTYTENGTHTDTNTHTLNTEDSNTKTGTDTQTLDTADNNTTSRTTSGTNVSEGSESDNQSTDEKSVYGFNSSTAVNTDKDVQTAKNKQSTTDNGTENGTDNTTHTGTVSNSKNETDNTTHTGTESDNGSGSDNKTITEETKRHGNLGVTTSQQMILSEMDLRKHNALEQVFADIDSVLVCTCYY